MLASLFSKPIALVALAAFLVTSHSARADEGASAVKGTVTLNGEPLKKGKTFFWIDEDQFVGARIRNGEFIIEKVPVGDRRITVEGEGVPAKYSDHLKTPLKVAVTKDGETLNLDLKD
jgi:hypothetical protein